MRNIICPKCGKPTEQLIDNVCSECYFKHFELAELPLVLHAKICSRCGALFDRGRWMDEGDLDEIVIQTVEAHLMVHDQADDIEIYIDHRKLTPYIYRIRVDVDAQIQGKTAHKELKCEVRIIREACDRCSRMSGGYFEGILQLRADGRIPSAEEIRLCKQIADNVVEKMRQKGDRLSFITDSIDLKEGTDLYVGSANTCRHICKGIIAKIGGSYSQSPTLFGQKDGKDIYRTTFAMRLPRFMPGDVIAYNDHVIEVINSGKHTRGLDLQDGSRFLEESEHLENATLIAHRNDAIKAVLVAIEENAIMVLHPSTYRTVTIKKPLFFNEPPGAEITVLNTEKGLFALPEDQIHTLE